MIEQRFLDCIAEEVKARPGQVAAAVALFDKGATVPFIARYRKDATSNLDEVKLEKIEERNVQLIALTNRRDAVLENVAKQNRLTDELRQKIENATDQTTLEDLYMPFKRQRRTKATVARDQGLEPLAEFLWEQMASAESIADVATTFISTEKGVNTVEEAIEGARNIIAERVSMDADTRAQLRERMRKEGVVKSVATKNVAEQKTKFEAYYDFSEPIRSIPCHRLLAVLRGVRMGVLRMDLVVNDEECIAGLVARYLKEPGSMFEEQIRFAVQDAYKRLLKPSIENEVVGAVREEADDEAIRVFRDNARSLLLAAPAGRVNVLGVDPGLRTGCKLAVLDSTGDFKENATIFPTEPQKDVEGAEKTLIALLDKYDIRGIAVGNGTGSREVTRFINGVLKAHSKTDAFCVYVNESGASIYSASKIARDEFPDLDITVRGAISIARRLQDPLAELVKLEPRSIGVGQYQHDVNQRRLREGLYRSVESCVNLVGVDVNTASAELLRYVAGIQLGTAQNIVTMRTQLGGFKSRAQLMDVPGVGEKTFQQCAGFMRISGGDEPLDRTAIHPEAYPVVRKMSENLGVSVADLVENREVIGKLDFAQFAEEQVGELTLKDIRSELLKPGRDPRKEFRVPKFLDGVDSVDDLEEGMDTEGVVTNVTDFGAFIDIGVHQDGLVHLSELTNRFVREPREVVKVGDIVRVRVIKLDKERARISLSMRALQAPRQRPPRRDRGEGQKAAPQGRGSQDSHASQGARRPVPSKAKARGGDRPPRSKGQDSGAQRRPQKRRQSGAQRPRQPQQPRPSNVGDKMDTLLADQLAALRDKFNND